MGKLSVSATLDEALIQRLDELAKNTERNRSWLISKAVEYYLEELEDAKIALSRLGEERLSPAALRKEIGV